MYEMAGSHIGTTRWFAPLRCSIGINNHASIPVLPPFESAIATEIAEQLIDLYARRAEASEQQDWEQVRLLDIEMDRASLLREAIRDRADQFDLA